MIFPGDGSNCWCQHKIIYFKYKLSSKLVIHKMVYILITTSS